MKNLSVAFEQNMEAITKMTPAQMQDKIKELDKICVCGKCPTYVGTGEKKLTFCAIGKSTIVNSFSRTNSGNAPLPRQHQFFHK